MAGQRCDGEYRVKICGACRSVFGGSVGRNLLKLSLEKGPSIADSSQDLDDLACSLNVRILTHLQCALQHLCPL